MHTFCWGSRTVAYERAGISERRETNFAFCSALTAADLMVVIMV